VDCDHFPFIFVGGNMGDGQKTITFKNLAVPYSTGSTDSRKASATAPTIRKYGTPAKNYTLIFDGISVNGQPVTDASALRADPNAGCTVTVKGNGATWTAVPATVTATVTAPGKIFVGNRQLLLKNMAVEQNGTWYVPAAGVCKALGCAVPSGTTQINGEAYLSLDALKSAGCTTSATYDASAKAVRIASVDRGVNLLAGEGNAAHCRWSELVCYETHLLYIKDAAGDYFYNKDSKATTGASYILTEQIRQYGTGTYTLTVDMKADKAAAATVNLMVNRSSSTKTVDLTTAWKTVTLEFTVTKESITNAALLIADKNGNSGVAFRNPKLVHTK
ncbi:MAG: hypothetical protein J6X61_01005, partial [Clostridia bacterium]|nr:hypothetical protein [Clostridia bacterium]